MRKKKIPELTETALFDWVSVQWLNFHYQAVWELKKQIKFSFYHFWGVGHKNLIAESIINKSKDEKLPWKII